MTQRIYTNDVALEQLKQAKAVESENRLAVLRNRIARAGVRKLIVIALVANARGDKTIASEARAKLAEKLDLGKGFKLADTFELVNSRRESRSKAVQEFSQVA